MQKLKYKHNTLMLIAAYHALHPELREPLLAEDQRGEKVKLEELLEREEVVVKS